MRNITAFTEAAQYKNYPAYISINEVDGDIVRISVRSRDQTNCSEVDMTKQEYLEMILRPLRNNKHLAEVFCRTPIPNSVVSDLSVTRTDSTHRTGTNFMSVMEAEAMLTATLIGFISDHK